MDTLDLYNGNTGKATALVQNLAVIGGVFVLLHLMLNPPIFAEDLKLAHAPVPGLTIDTGQTYNRILNEISPEARTKNFDESIRRKYPNSLIKTVTSGVKHVKMTKYYDGKPVRINLVEIDRKLASNFEIKPALSSTTSNLKSRRTITTIAKDQIGAFKTSATTKGGFYIGRYEQGMGNVCKAGLEPYDNITRNQAKTYSEDMYRGNTYVTSELSMNRRSAINNCQSYST